MLLLCSINSEELDKCSKEDFNVLIFQFLLFFYTLLSECSYSLDLTAAEPILIFITSLMFNDNILTQDRARVAIKERPNFSVSCWNFIVILTLREEIHFLSVNLWKSIKNSAACFSASVVTACDASLS